MRYLADLGVKLDEVVVLAILTELSAPSMGEFSREGFTEGWKRHQYVSLPLFSLPQCLKKLFPFAETLIVFTAPKPFPNNRATSPAFAANYPQCQTSLKRYTDTPSVSRSPQAKNPSPSTPRSSIGVFFLTRPRSLGRHPRLHGWTGGSLTWRDDGARE